MPTPRLVLYENMREIGCLYIKEPQVFRNSGYFEDISAFPLVVGGLFDVCRLGERMWGNV